MRELKIKHYFLYAASFLLLWWADIPFGSILSLFLWQQMAFYLWHAEFTKKSQIDCLIHSFALLPLFFFLGAVASFVGIYIREGNWLLFFFAFTLNFLIAYNVVLFGISFFIDYKHDSSLYSLYIENIRQIKSRKFYFLKLTVFFIGILLLLPLLSIDYAIVGSYAMTHVMGKKYQTKLGYVAKPAESAPAM